MERNKPLIIGITGAFGSGKSTAASFFAAKGFNKITLSSFLEEEAKKRNINKITRKVLQDIGNKLRLKYGKGILAKRTLEYLFKNKIQRAIVDGIRNIGEIEELRKNSNFKLVSIVADRKIRFNRLKIVKKNETHTWELFNKLDYRDVGVGEKETGLQVAICVLLADYFINNNETLEDYKKKLKKILDQINMEL